jgi:two-component system sensor histidine kinase YesM
MLKIFDSVQRISIQGKLILFMTTVVIFISLSNLFFYNMAYSSMDEYNRLLKDYSQVNSLSITLIQGRDSFTRYVSESSDLEGDSLELYKYRISMDTTNNLINEIVAASNSLDTVLQSNAIKNSIQTYSDEINSIIDSKATKETKYLLFLKAKNDSIYIEGYIKQLLNTKLSEGEWYHNQLTNRVRTIRVINFTSVLILMFISLLFIFAIANSITNPVKKLTQFARNVSRGNFVNKELEIKSSEEINILASTLNQMSKNILNMISMQNQLHEEEIKSIRISNELNEARFLALQSQIAPHFLFNTLNAIARFSMFEGAKKTTHLIESLSSIFRYNLKGTEKVLLSEELKIMQAYAAIQSARFGDRIRFDIRCKPGLGDIHVPRFILQPLVENAVIHGLEPKESSGRVRVKIYEKSENLVIKVLDNGVGIHSGKLAQLLGQSEESVQRKGDTTGIGLNNVRERVLLYSRKKDSFTMKSKENIGTVITLNIPES